MEQYFKIENVINTIKIFKIRKLILTVRLCVKL